MLKYGVHSRALVKDYQSSPSPSYRRVPFYPFILMIGMVLHPGIDVSKQDGECIAKGKGECINTIIYLKIINIILLMSCAILGAYIVYVYSQSALFSLVSFLLISLSSTLGFVAVSFYHELLGGFLLLAASIALSNMATKSFSIIRVLLFGLLLGILVLTKAIVYYFVFLIPILLFVWWLYTGIRTIDVFKRCLLVFSLHIF